MKNWIERRKEYKTPKKQQRLFKSMRTSLKRRKKGIISIAYHQGKVFKKSKEKEKFIKLVSQLGIHKNTIMFKINVLKLCERYPKLLGSFIGLEFFKNFCKDIKIVCRENEQRYIIICSFFEHFYFSRLSLWCRSLSQICKQKFGSLSIHSNEYILKWIITIKTKILVWICIHLRCVRILELFTRKFWNSKCS